MPDLNPFLAGVDPALLEGVRVPQPFAELEDIKKRFSVSWWEHLCCWHSSRYRDGLKWMVQDKWGNPDPEFPDQVFDLPNDADARAKELNSDNNFTAREPKPKED